MQKCFEDQWTYATVWQNKCYELLHKQYVLI